MQVVYQIFMNDMPFTAREDTIDYLEATLKSGGWRYNFRTEGWDCPETVKANPTPSQYKMQHPA